MVLQRTFGEERDAPRRQRVVSGITTDQINQPDTVNVSETPERHRFLFANRAFSKLGERHIFARHGCFG